MAKPKDDGLPPELDQLLQQDAGKGVSSELSDQLLPIAAVLQTNSPQCDPRGADYIDGAEPGMFWLRGSEKPIRESLDVTCCGMVHVYTEWPPGRTGNLVARHVDLPDDVDTIMDDSTGRQTYIRRGNKNVLQDTRELYLLIDGTLHMFPAYGTKHTFVRALESRFNQLKHPKTGAVLPSFAKRYRLTTVPRSNAKGRWFDVKFEDIGWTPLADYQKAKAITESIERGLLTSGPVAAIGGPKAA